MSTGVVVLVTGLGLLGFASDWFVLGAARLATLLRVPAVIVGAVIVGFGTSAPELLVTLLACLRGEAELAVGNVVGSNLANLTLVLGSAAMVGTIVVSSSTVRREAPISTAAVCVFGSSVVMGLGVVSGIVLAAGMVAALLVIVRVGLTARAPEDEELVTEVAELEQDLRLGRAVVMTGVGLAGTLIGAQLVVSSAVRVAGALGLSEGFVGLTLVAVGTSLPELVTSVQAVRRGEDELIVGNVLGSNLFNSLAAGAMISLVSGGVDVEGRLAWASGLMIVVALVATVIMARRRGFSRTEGVALLVTYVATVPLFATG